MSNKKIKNIFIAFVSCLLLFVTFNSCKKSTRFENDYLIFGSSVSECDVNYVQLFMLADGKLYQDAQDKKSDRIKLKRRKLAANKYELAKKLLDNFPDYFKTTTSSYFGKPDIRDQVEIIIEWKEFVTIKLRKQNQQNPKQHLKFSLQRVPTSESPSD